MSFKSGYEQLIEVLAYKTQKSKEDTLPRDVFAVEADEEYIKLIHSEKVLNSRMAEEFAEAVNGHIWVMYVNKTNEPFYTPDDSAVNIPHKHDGFLSWGGLKSEAIEILLPISSNLLLGMYDEKTYRREFLDRQVFSVTSLGLVEYFNAAQVMHSQRCVFSIPDNFSLAESLCEKHLEIRDGVPSVEVL